MDRWQVMTDMEVNAGAPSLRTASAPRCGHREADAPATSAFRVACTPHKVLQVRNYSSYASVLGRRAFRSPAAIHSEFLIHAADVEGLCQGIDEQLVESAFSPAFDNEDTSLTPLLLCRARRVGDDPHHLRWWSTKYVSCLLQSGSQQLVPSHAYRFLRQASTTFVWSSASRAVRST